MPRLEDAFRNMVLEETGDDIYPENEYKSSDELLLAIVRLLTALLEKNRGQEGNSKGLIPSPS